MSNAAKVNFSVTNLTQTVGQPLQGISFVQGQSIRGPFASPDEVFNSWPAFVAKHGGLSAQSDAPLLCKRLLEKGGSIRFSRVGHYDTTSDPTSLTATKASQPEVTKIEFDSAFTTGNVIDITLNGDDLETVEYTLNNDSTLDMIAEVIMAHPDVLDCSVVEEFSNSSDNRLLFITPKVGSSVSIDAISVTGGTTQPVDTVSPVTEIVSQTGSSLFVLKPKYEGADYNNFLVTITRGSNGIEGYFNIYFKHKIEQNLQESYLNLKIDGPVTAANSNYLSQIVGQSKYFEVEYMDITDAGEYPLPISFQLRGGSDGAEVTNADYVGDSNARNGFYAFDQYDDSYQLATFDNEDIYLEGAAYAKNRGDLIYFPFLSGMSKSTLLTQREALGDNKHMYPFGGITKINDPITNQVRTINPTGDVFALIAASDRNFGEWYSFAGPNRGVIDGVLGVANNFGAPANARDLDDLANKQINMIITRNGSTKLWGNFSGQYKNDQERFISIVRLIMFLKKSLRPTLETFLEEPNDIPTWKRIYYTVKPFLDSLVTKRALYSYEWQGDQNAASLNQLQINNASDVGEGKYKINFLIKAIPSIQEINVNIVLTPAGVEFEIVSELI